MKIASECSAQKKMTTTDDVMAILEESRIKWVRLNFCDPFGFLQQISVRSHEINADAFESGIPRLDGSSIKGFREIYESDMLLKPDPSTFAILPEYFDKDHHHNNKDGGRNNNVFASRAARMYVD